MNVLPFSSMEAEMLRDFEVEYGEMKRLLNMPQCRVDVAERCRNRMVVIEDGVKRLKGGIVHTIGKSLTGGYDQQTVADFQEQALRYEHALKRQR